MNNNQPNTLILNFWRLPAPLSLAVFLLDRATKHWVVAQWAQNGAPRVVIPGFLHFVHYRNTGGAWGILADYTQVLSLISAVVAVLLIVYFRTLAEGRSERALALAFMLGGIVGNLWDRVVYKEVIDFILVFYRSFTWPAFNVADSAITCGVAVFIISSFIYGNEQEPTSDTAPDDS